MSSIIYLSIWLLKLLLDARPIIFLIIQKLHISDPGKKVCESNDEQPTEETNRIQIPNSRVYHVAAKPVHSGPSHQWVGAPVTSTLILLLNLEANERYTHE